jgi:DNA-binding IscR family transcriptional regulator
VSDAFLIAMCLVRAQGQLVSMAHLARSLALPLFRVERAARALANAGITESHLGRKGGYRCVRQADQIVARDVFRAVCKSPGGPALALDFSSLGSVLDAWMERHTLADLMGR